MSSCIAVCLVAVISRDYTLGPQFMLGIKFAVGGSGPVVFSSMIRHNKTILEFAVCDMRDYQGLVKCYQPRVRLSR